MTIETKYNVRDEVWAINSGLTPYPAIITGIVAVRTDEITLTEYQLKGKVFALRSTATEPFVKLTKEEAWSIVDTVREQMEAQDLSVDERVDRIVQKINTK